MSYGYCGNILHVYLNEERVEIEHPNEAFYRNYLGGSAMGAYYLFKHTPKGSEPLGQQNTLCLFVGLLTGAPISGQSRVCATAKSPVTNLIGDSQAGGYWPAELKFAGFDGIVIHGKSEKPVYLWIHDGQAELKDASHLWGIVTGEVEDIIREELRDRHVEVLQCGPAAEKGVRFSALINNANRVNGRTGMGAVMASKCLKAIAVRGQNRPDIAHPKKLMDLARNGFKCLDDSGVAGLTKLGTPEAVSIHNARGDLPTRNWYSGVFESADSISGEQIAQTILKKRATCFSCVVRCKGVVEVTDGPYPVDPRYGAPEYETLSTLGSYCGVSDLNAIARANQLCNMYGMDTISCGATIAWAMDCFEQKLLSLKDTDGIDLHFGNAKALVEMVELIGRREGFGYILGEGSARASEALGIGKDRVATVKKHELPAQMPQSIPTLALIYAVNPIGADHMSNEYDASYRAYSQRMAELNLISPQPTNVLNAEKVRYALYTQWLFSCLDSLSVCMFVFGPAWQLFGPSELVEAVSATTGWDVSLWELMKVGERRLNLLRSFNTREGIGSEVDVLPKKLQIPLKGGPTNGYTVNFSEVEDAKSLYYQMCGWDKAGLPTRAKLEEIALGWVADELGL